MAQVFKGIALFTPGSDLVYCIDPSKQDRWHINLCIALQEKLGLSEPPHFLVPGYTATIDRWRDPKTGDLRTMAEIYPPVQRYQALLNVMFNTHGLKWQVAQWQEESCSPMVLETYRHQFPQLWQRHDLVMRLDTPQPREQEIAVPSTPTIATSSSSKPFSYVLRMFVSGHNAATEKTLKNLHQVLEQGLGQPYTLKVIDVFKHPEQAELNHVAATPTLVRVYPEPVRKIVGEFEDMDKILQIISANNE